MYSLFLFSIDDQYQSLDKMEQNSKRFTTFSVVVFLIAFHVVLLVPLIYRNSNFALFKLLAAQNVTTISDDNFRGRCNCTVSEVKVLQGETQNGASTANNNVIASQEGSNNSSLTSSTNDEYKLLHGLLASGFDEASCISRVQSHLYRKASPHKPSPYLISKLRNYEEIHQRCGPYSSAYNTSMTNIERSKNNNAATMCKYLVWTPVIGAGLGNQILSIASTFLYALLTDRVLLIQFEKDIENLYCEPFLNSTWILPNNTPILNETVIEAYKNYLLGKQKVKFSMEDSPSVQFLINLSNKPSDRQKFFHCDDSQDLLSKVPSLILLSDQYFLPSLFMIPLFNKELDKMFPDKERIFHHLGRYLFHPSNEAWEIISKFYETHLAEADERIGIQIRVFNPVRTPHKAIMDLVLSCTKDQKILPELAVGVQNYSIKQQTRKVAVLVASLYAQYAEDLMAMYMNKTTVKGEIVQVYQASHEEQQKFSDNSHNMKAWSDMYLLSLSDVLVTSSMSTFGYVAQGLGNLKAWRLYRLLKNTTHFPACERDYLSIEPCYHVPPKHYCDGTPIPNFVSSNFTHIRECKDFFPGAKVVNA